MNACILPKQLDEGRLDQLLELWAGWMRSSEPLRELWYPDGACGCVGGGYSQTFDDMVLASDQRAAEAVDAVIEGLSALPKLAVMHKHLYAVFKFSDLETHYLDARTALGIELPMRGVY